MKMKKTVEGGAGMIGDVWKMMRITVDIAPAVIATMIMIVVRAGTVGDDMSKMVTAIPVQVVHPIAALEE